MLFDVVSVYNKLRNKSRLLRSVLIKCRYVLLCTSTLYLLWSWKKMYCVRTLFLTKVQWLNLAVTSLHKSATKIHFTGFQRVLPQEQWCQYHPGVCIGESKAWRVSVHTIHCMLITKQLNSHLSYNNYLKAIEVVSCSTIRRDRQINKLHDRAN